MELLMILVQKIRMIKMTKIETYLMNVGGVFILLGASAYLFYPIASTYIYIIGALLFGCIQIKNGYRGNNIIIRRLRRQQIFAALLLMLTGLLMITNTYRWIYCRHNEWVICLTIAAIMELYSSFRLSHELKKENS